MTFENYKNKHMKLKIALIFPLLLFVNFVFAQAVSEEQASILAKNFYYEKINIKQAVAYEDVKLQLKDVFYEDNFPIFRIFEPVAGKGFILLGFDESITPVLAYSFESSYKSEENLPPNFKEWIAFYAEQVISIQKNPYKKIHPYWERYAKKTNLSNIKHTKDAAPLLTTAWNQGCGYNSLCPEDVAGPCGRVWAGCVATAMAQVMNYHEHPVSGEGSHTYTHADYGEQSADFASAVYDWANMPNNSGNTEISKLIYHCGVAVDMDYSPTGSGAYSRSVRTAWKEYFKYSPNLILTNKHNYTAYNWAKMLRDEIDNGRPLYYSGHGTGGHAFNIDGYQGDDYFHLNWGWGGSYNGYYYLNGLTPGTHNYSNGQSTIVGAIDRDIYTGLDCSGAVVLSSSVPYSGTTTSSTNTVNRYGSSYYHSTGKEVVHQITTSFPGRLRASLTNLNDSILDIFILSHCHQDSLIAFGDTVAVADDTAPGTYYIVVDGRNAFEGDYTLTVIAPDMNADLIIDDQMVAPNIIDAGQPGAISFKLKNIGNASAASSKTNIYYSVDNYLDASDILIEQIDIPALNPGAEHPVSQIVTIPEAAVEGAGYILFVADAENTVTETDEMYNTEIADFNVPPPGAIDCASSVSLTSGEWYSGNTKLYGNANIDTYLYHTDFTAKEVIHSITATHNGVAEVSFSEKVPGQLSVMFLTSCNENTCDMSIGVWNAEDSTVTETVRMFAGITYYFIVDGHEGVEGEYSLKVDLPGVCPEPHIYYWDELDICASPYAGVNLNTSSSYTDVQWYKDNVPIPDATSAWYRAKETGTYKVKVSDYGCTEFSESVNVSLNPEPTLAEISAAGDTVFCERNSVTLNLNTGFQYDVQWMKDETEISGETGMSLIAEESGYYCAKVSNGGCSILSDEIQVKAKPVTADVGAHTRVNSKDLAAWFSLDINDNRDLSGNNNTCNNYCFNYPEDRKNDWNKASYFNGKWEYARLNQLFTSPNIFTLSLWFKTTTTSGGRLIGLGDTQNSLSTLSDRMIYMDDEGKLNFGVIDGSPKTISSTEAYNDNEWHHVAVSLSGAGMKLYVDGTLKAEDVSVSQGESYTGWWKMAYGYIDPGFANIPSSLYYRGILDEVKIWERELSANEINILYDESLIFDAALSEQNLCEPGLINLNLSNTEEFIDYQLRNDADDSPVGSPASGNSSSISLPAGLISETTMFNVLAVNSETGCSMELSTTYPVAVHDLPTAAITGDTSICEGQSADIAINLSGTAPWNITYTDGTNTFTESTSDNPYVFSATNAGVYEITTLSDAYCTGTNISGSATINVNDLPEVNLGDDVSITTEEEYTLDAGEGFASYLWSDNSSEQTLRVNGSETGTGIFEYWVLVEDVNTCENSDTIIVTVKDAIGINNLDLLNIIIAPNPSNGNFRILNAAGTRIEICDISGKIILKDKIIGNEHPINMPLSNKACYFIKFIDNEAVRTSKIIIN